MKKQQQEKYNFWLKNAPQSVVDEIKKYDDREKLIAFNKDIEFGTAGMRGEVKYGTFFINEFIIAKGIYGYGKALLDLYGDEARKEGVVIAHDSRLKYQLFTDTTAGVLSAMGIPVYIFKNNELQPTPLLSFTIAQNKFVGGVNITASHNSKRDNGFKVYDKLGKQFEPRDVQKIVKHFKSIKNIFAIPQDKKNVFELDEKVVNVYIDTLMKKIPFYQDINRSDMKVVYSSLHGTGTKIATKIFKKLNVGFELVKDQTKPDKDFPLAPKPNPEEIEVYDLGIKLADKTGAKLVFVTDPDADRFGIMVKHNGEWVHMNGNELPIIQLEYKLRRLQRKNLLNKKQFIVKSAVTSTFGEKLAKNYGIHTFISLPGFKWLIKKALHEESRGLECLFVYEESYGSVLRTMTRDKDAFQALIQVIELAHFYKVRGKTLVDVYNDIESKMGIYYKTWQKRIELDPLTSDKVKKEKLDFCRSLQIGKKIGGFKIEEIRDFKKGWKGVPKEDFVSIILDNVGSITVRPSGTEPILRIYYDIYSTKPAKLEQIVEKLKKIEF